MKAAEFDKPALARTVHKTILEKSQQFLGEIASPKNCIYRGLSHPVEALITYVSSPTNRAPRASSKMQDYFFRLLISSKGYTANRNNSLFCTTSYREAHYYAKEYNETNGDIVVLFPTESYSYTIARIDMFSHAFADLKAYIKCNTKATEYFRNLKANQIQNGVDVNTVSERLGLISKAYHKLNESPDWWPYFDSNSEAFINIAKQLDDSGLTAENPFGASPEIMLHSTNVLAIEATFYKEYVLPLLLFN